MTARFATTILALAAQSCVSRSDDQALLNNATPSSHPDKILMTSELTMTSSQHEEELAMDNLQAGNVKLAEKHANNALRKNPSSKNARLVIEAIGRNKFNFYPGGYDQQEAVQAMRGNRRKRS